MIGIKRKSVGYEMGVTEKLLAQIRQLKAERDWLAEKFVDVRKNPDMYQCHVLYDPEIISKERLLMCVHKAVEENDDRKTN